MSIESPRLRGQEVQLLVLDGANRVEEIKAIGSYDVASKYEIQQDGFIGETTDEYDFIYSGESGSFKFQINSSKWARFKARINAKARRVQPTLTFNIVRVQLFANGSSLTTTYQNVAWGEIAESGGSRRDFVSLNMPFACSDAIDAEDAFL